MEDYSEDIDKWLAKICTVEDNNTESNSPPQAPLSVDESIKSNPLVNERNEKASAEKTPAAKTSSAKAPAAKAPVVKASAAKASAAKASARPILKLIEKISDVEVEVLIESQASTSETVGSQAVISEVKEESRTLAFTLTSKTLIQKRKINCIEVLSKDNDESDDNDNALTKDILNST
ncbi:hypothetical protein GLOIN_2v1837712 [Rhizophagus clarus]|uniref:Uncharacterized protein n=1 Tax=Rhizophagus clarus TaxID=94130 RepID=A0A8H3LWT8_9GLOM|nr:hypothetical protein GLOIN_2v1837712 [Rhizophagus clarus]